MISTAFLSEVLDKAAASAEFIDQAWLTFYLYGDPSKLRLLASDLEVLGARNLNGEEGGFLYAKLPVRLEIDDVQRVAAETAAAAQRHSILIDHIDLDSSPDVERSKFFSLIEGRR